MKDEILIVFETNKVVNKEVLNDSIGLQRSDCVIVTFEEIMNHQINVKDFFAIMDGTIGNKIINQNKSHGSFLKENSIEYLLMKNGIYVIKAPNISQLTALHFDHSERNQNMFQEAIKEYDDKINFIKNKNIKLRTKNDFQNSYANGIILNDLMPVNPNQKIYKLVKAIPQQKEQNVEYLTLEHLDILKDIEKLLQYIK